MTAGTGAVNRDELRRTTAPALLCERARRAPDDIAFRSKHLGIYRERSFRDYALLVSRTAKALAALALSSRANTRSPMPCHNALQVCRKTRPASVPRGTVTAWQSCSSSVRPSL